MKQEKGKDEKEKQKRIWQVADEKTLLATWKEQIRNKEAENAVKAGIFIEKKRNTV